MGRSCLLRCEFQGGARGKAADPSRHVGPVSTAQVSRKRCRCSSFTWGLPVFADHDTLTPHLQITVGLLQKAMASSGKSRILIDGFPRNASNRETFVNMVGAGMGAGVGVGSEGLYRAE